MCFFSFSVSVSISSSHEYSNSPTPQAILDVAEFIVSEIINLNEENAQKEGKFTTDTVSALLSAYPDKNVVVYYDQDSGYEFYNGAHRHYELDLELGFTKGYEIWVFDYGWFELAGDGGYQNWAYGGCVDTTDSTYSLIYFCDIVVTL
ncbi:hypothetical protein NKR23_g6713 [Pleurostoma richardsiae]|uniref:Uncharacterized protein n=1 Tax=Pleurostoma richardsiae TaxID=41990 RepID=A0AA38RY06_9PEZI|nr:hypothetical protein NKR23_g6713 [Pleurostoma richardsiae]